MLPEKIREYGDALYAAVRSGQTLAPLASRELDISVDVAYRIS